MPLGRVSAASDAAQAERALAAGDPVDLVVTDMAMPDVSDGLRVLRAAREQWPDSAVIILTAYGNIEGALDTIQQGAFDYLAKPFDVDALTRVARRALEQKRLVEENRSLRQQVKVRSLVGRSPALLEVYKQVARAASTQVPVLITGETGTGKELIASLVHAHSGRVSAPLVRFNCAAIPADLAEAELFGHARGAFTGATAWTRAR